MYSSIIAFAKDKWSHSGFQKYVKNIGLIFIGKIISLAISFFTTIYVIRHLGPDNYGVVAFAVSFVGIFSFLSSLGIDQILYRELSNDISKKESLLGTGFGLKVIGSLSSFLLILIFSYFTNSNAITRLVIAINAAGMVFGAANVIGLYFQAQVKSIYQSLGLIIVTLILSVLKILVVYFDKGIIYFSLVLFLENVLYAIIGIYIYRREKNSIFKWRFDRGIAKSMLADSWPLILTVGFTLVYTRIDQVMLNFLTSSTANVGIYDSAARLSEVWYFIPGLIVGAVFPAIVNARKTDIGVFRSRLVMLYSLMFYMGIIVAVPVSLFSKFIIVLIYGQAFVAASGVLSIYVWAGVPAFLSIAMGSYLVAENYARISFISSFVGMVSNVLLNLYLIPRFGMTGAAYATLISYSLIPLSVFVLRKTRSQGSIFLEAVAFPFTFAARVRAHPHNNVPRS